MSTLQASAQKQLRQFVEQIERLEEEKKQIASDIRDKYTEAKAVGFDVKAPFGDYARITGADDGGAAREALSLLLASGVAHEVRCTVPEDLLGADDMARLAGQLADLGVSRLVLQTCRADGRAAAPLPEPLRRAAADFVACVELRH